ncbi:MAG: non-canonical purine NTP pyrophosphatase [Spirochaetia bacterium]|nr:non-canonical purine NTP pyrophosphatase [Spirochaetia bacterium]MCF7942311.1 non-canonical purine NTP pyrophosphatase [Spirochaetia bacterium]
MNILLATGNAHKKSELAAIFSGHSIAIPEDLGLPFDVEEHGMTFLDNSMLKAQALWDLLKERSIPGSWAVIADDSGLVVPALGGAPGIYSARYGSDVYGRMLESPERNRYLLEQLGGITDRRAFFVCCMSLIKDDYVHYTVQETIEGTIIDKEIGSGGFGYDPVFYIESYGMTAAQLDPELKNSISHRGKAGKQIAKLL